MSKKNTVTFTLIRSVFLLILLAAALPAHATDIELDPDGLTTPPEPAPPQAGPSVMPGDPAPDSPAVSRPSPLWVYGGWLTTLRATLRCLEIFRLLEGLDQ